MATTRYIWDYASDAYLMEKDETGATTAVYTNEPVQYGNLVSQRRGDATRYHHFDGQGSTRELTDPAQAVTDSASYTAYGEPVTASGATINPFRYVGAFGYHTDESIQTNYVRERTYSERDAGRWLSEDPMQFFDGPNKYVLRDPINLVDPSGLFVFRRCRPRRQFCAPNVTCRQLQERTACDCPAYGEWEPISEFCKQCHIKDEEEFKAIVDQLVEMNCTMPDWKAALPCCPRKLSDVDKTWEKDNELFVGLFHPPASVCRRSPPPAKGHSCQQCCYDKQGNLITSGSGAGTPDYYCSDLKGGVPPREHITWDVKPFACGWNWYHGAGWTPDPGCKIATNGARKRP